MPRLKPSLIALALCTVLGVALPANALALHRLTVTVQADEHVVTRSAQNGYTISVDNPNDAPVTLLRIRDQLPDHGHGGQGAAAFTVAAAGAFTYLPGTSTGVTRDEPTIRGNDLTWHGPWTIPRRGSVRLHFGVRVSDMVATYYTTAGASADGVNVVGAKRVGEIVVVDDGPLAPEVSASAPKACRGDAGSYLVTLQNRGSRGLTVTSLRIGLPDGTTYRAGTTSGLTGADPTLTNGGHILTWAGSWRLDAGARATVRFGVRYGGANGTVSTRLRVLFHVGSGPDQDVGTGPTAPVRVSGCA